MINQLTTAQKRFPSCHQDTAWAAALATHDHTTRKGSIGSALLLEDGSAMIYDGENPPRRVMLRD